MRRRRNVAAAGAGRAAVCVLLAFAAVAACAVGPDTAGRLRVIVPNTAGSGYDLTARTLVIALREAGLADDVQAFNLTGGSGTVALTRLVHERGNDRLLLLMGLGLVGSTRATPDAARISDAIPLARLVGEPEALIVPAGSPFTTVGGLLGSWGRGELTAGIGSHLGGPDHLALTQTARAAGIDQETAAVERYDGGGALLGALLGHRVDFIMTGISEYRHAIAAGEVRVLAVTSAERVPGLSAPTLLEQGYDLEVVNWRGLLAPPGLTPGQRDDLLALLDDLHASDAWREALRENGWQDAYLTGEPFARFLAEEHARVGTLLDG
ncbi:tripartite tricarboxylate transporter substrate-binding protein [Streptomyces sp. MP131-18]|uniref:Bug family tripartite tricarboxylate transporter substrate binding protein n=1 Tax=Streptomyces sp. MP131-18 TaxID=1857892 RepID=UPI00097C019A|nr:tripartite tricarboxylate transporter substrate-binding protein [Streptomyces sp. MP131-18]